MAARQADLFAAASEGPEGLAYRPHLVTAEEEAELIGAIAALELKPFEFRGYLGLRRVKAFGWRYDYGVQTVQRAAEIPPFLLSLRARAAQLARLQPEQLQHALVTEYQPGAGIGWHRDRPQFGEVVAVSLASACVIRFRRRRAAGWERASLPAEPRSAYLLTGPARSEWEHSIAPGR